MATTTELMKSSDIVEVARQVFSEERIEKDLVVAAQDTLLLVMKQAQEYGIPKADVVKAYLKGSLQDRRCGCLSCERKVKG